VITAGFSVKFPRSTLCPAVNPAAPHYTEFKRNANPYLPVRLQVSPASTDNNHRGREIPYDRPHNGCENGSERTSDMPSTVYPRYTVAEKVALAAIRVISWPLEKFVQLVKKFLKWLDNLELIVL
jgi:hypothetical protein